MVFLNSKKTSFYPSFSLRKKKAILEPFIQKKTVVMTSVRQLFFLIAH